MCDFSYFITVSCTVYTITTAKERLFLRVQTLTVIKVYSLFLDYTYACMFKWHMHNIWTRIWSCHVQVTCFCVLLLAALTFIVQSEKEISHVCRHTLKLLVSLFKTFNVLQVSSSSVSNFWKYVYSHKFVFLWVWLMNYG